MMKMQAVRWYGPEDLRMDLVEVPQVGPGEVIVKIGTALTCGTDFKTFRKGHALLVKETPAPFGHELAGTIAEVGAGVTPPLDHCPGGTNAFGVGPGGGVTRFQKNDRVVTANSAPCDQCYFCQKQEFNLCENLQFLNGAYAEYIRIPAQVVRRNLYKIPGHLSFRDAALTEPLACVLHCFDRLAIQPAETLCVLGAGTCGLLFTQLAKLHNVKVLVVGRGQKKLEVAKKLGADQTVSVLDENFRKVVRGFSEAGYGPDVVVDAVGRTETWQLAVDLVRKGGRVWFYGGCAKGSQVTFDAHRLHYDEVSCFGVFHHTPAHFARSLQLIAEGKIEVDALIQGEVKLSELHTVFRKGTSDNPMKIAVIP